MTPNSEISNLIDQFDYSKYETPAAQLKARWEASIDALTKKLLQTEIDALNFSFHDGEPQSMFSNTDANGEVHEYPSIKSLDLESLSYLEARLNETPNSRLKVRYSQLLFNALKKGNGKFAKEAIDRNIELISAARDGNDDHLYSDISNALHISFKSKYRVEDVKQIILNRIVDDPDPYEAFVILVPRILDFNNLLTRPELEALALKANKIWEGSEKLPLSSIERICENGISISNRLNSDRKLWYSRMGTMWEKALNSRKKDDTSGMMPIHFCELAIENFQKAGEKEKEKELLKLLTELRSNLKLNTFEITFTAEETEQFRSTNKLFVSRVLELEPEKIFGFLASDETLFPNTQKLKEAVKGRGNSFFDFAQVIKFDINKNSRQENTRLIDDVKLEALMEEYQWYFKFISMPVLRGIFVDGNKAGKVGVKEMVDFLRKNSWLAKGIIYKDSGGEPSRHNWLAMIAPGLLEFFIQIKAIRYGGINYQNYIMCVDSLVIKFEGILRDFARVLRVDTVVRTMGNTREAYIEELLSNQKIKQTIGQDDLLLFTYLFTTSGLNLRNNIAHGFLKYNEYSLSTALMIVAALLRISRYQVNTNNLVI